MTGTGSFDSTAGFSGDIGVFGSGEDFTALGVVVTGGFSAGEGTLGGGFSFAGIATAVAAAGLDVAGFSFEGMNVHIQRYYEGNMSQAHQTSPMDP